MGANDPITYLCIDIEASGPVPGLYNMVSLGVVPVRPGADGKWAVETTELYQEYQPVFPGWDKEAEKVHKVPRAHLEANGLEIKPAMEALRDWAKKTAGKSRRVFVGHNAPFDWSFVAYYFAYVGMENPFGYNALDTKALAMGKLDLGWLETSKENLQRLLPLPPQEEGQVHNALYDARYQAMILAALLNLPKRTDLPK
jgi:DNA polymerase III epsilon subunit-like protein